MNKESKQMYWLGIFVVGGLTFLAVILYSLGDQRNFFDRTFTLHGIFEDVSGLRTGNSVRLSGVNIGTVDNIKIVDDSSVLVAFVVQKEMQRYIRGNATASVATDGLMGNKLILIHPGKIGEPGNDILVEDGDTLERESVVEMADMLATLEQTNANVSDLSAELVAIIKKVSAGEGSLGKLITEPDLVNGLQEAIAEIENFAQQGKATILELNEAVRQINEGEGMIGALLSDSSMTNNLAETVTNLQTSTEDIANIGTEMKSLLQVIQSGDGIAAAVLTNPEMASNVEQTLVNIRAGTDQFNEVMEALKHNILLRRYFKKREREGGGDSELGVDISKK